MGYIFKSQKKKRRVFIELILFQLQEGNAFHFVTIGVSHCAIFYSRSVIRLSLHHNEFLSICRQQPPLFRLIILHEFLLSCTSSFQDEHRIHRKEIKYNTFLSVHITHNKPLHI